MLVAMFWACVSLVPLPGVSPGSQTAADEVKPRPSATFALKAEGSARSDAQWMAFTPSGQLAIRYADPRSGDAALGVFDATTGKTVTSVAIKGGGGIENRRPVCAVAPGGEWVAYADGQHLRFLALPRGSPPPCPEAIKLHPQAVGESAGVWLDAKGETAFVYHSTDTLPTLERWGLNKKSKEQVVQTPEERALVYAAALDPTARQMAVSAKLFDRGNPWIEFWTLADKPTQVVIETRARAPALVYSPDGKTLAAGFVDGSVAWYNAATGKAIKQLPPLGKFTVRTVAFHTGGQYLACGTHDQGTPNLFLVDVTSGEVVAKLPADPNGVTAVCFGPGGDKLAAFGASGTVTIWDATKLLKLERD